jgi:predicted AAA+ superfamily ATPase
MWIKRDIQNIFNVKNALPLKVLKGPRQVGKTAILEQLGTHKPIYFDDLNVRRRAQEDPRLFFDQYQGPLILDEASLAAEIFPELKRRVDEYRKKRRAGENSPQSVIDIWLTGSNQTLLQNSVQESLAGRASYFDMNTLSIHEIQNHFGEWSMEKYCMRGGWPELYQEGNILPSRYIDDLILTFIERDIVQAAGIEKKSAFNKTLGLIAGRIGQLFNASDIAKIVGVEVLTIQSWTSLLEQNGIVRRLPSFSSNLNQRLIKAPKIYFEDAGLVTRLQGWSDYHPLFVSSLMGFINENIAIIEVGRFFTNRGLRPILSYVRSKEKVEVDLLIELPNQRYIAAEVKLTPQNLTNEQMKLLDSLKLNIVERWILSPTDVDIPAFSNARVVSFKDIWNELSKFV